MSAGIKADTAMQRLFVYPNGVPIETLSKLMGHTSIRSTQIYAKITAEKVSDDIENLSKQIESIESFICNAI